MTVKRDRINGGKLIFLDLFYRIIHNLLQLVVQLLYIFTHLSPHNHIIQQCAFLVFLQKVSVCTVITVGLHKLNDVIQHVDKLKLCSCPQSKKTYEQKCRDKEEADQNVNRNANNTRNIEKVLVNPAWCPVSRMEGNGVIYS